MSQTINDMPVSLLPFDLFSNLLDAAANGGVCPLDKGDGSPPIAVSSYKYLEELAKHPDLYGEGWKQALISAGVGIGGSTIGLATLAIATGPLAPFTAIAAAIAAPFFGANRIATIIVCNATQGEMTLGEYYPDCGVQTGRPVYADVDIDTGSTRSTKPDVIPGMVQIVPGLLQAGVGMYRFEKDLDMGIGFYGTGGAISWTFTDPIIATTMALAWLVPETGNPGLAVTADLGKYSSLKDFYDKTAGARKVDLRSHSKGSGGQDVRIKASAASRDYPDSVDPHDLAITVYAGS